MNHAEGIKVFSFSPSVEKHKKASSAPISIGEELKGTMCNSDIDLSELLKLINMPYIPVEEEEPEEEDDIDLEEATKNLIFFIAGKCFNDYSSSIKSDKRNEELSSYLISFLIDNYDDVLDKINHDLSLSNGDHVEPYITNTIQQIIRDIDSQINEEESCEWKRLKELLRASDKREDIEYVISLLDNGCSEETLNVVKIVFPKLIEVYNNRKK